MEIINERVCILLPTYNGEKFLEEQLASYANQKHQDWYLVAMDDGSNDDSLNILNNFRDKYPSRVSVIQNEENIGIKKAFEKLIKNAPDFNYYMFSDQDDVWHPEKINVLLSKLIETENTLSKNKPILIHSDLQVTDQYLNIKYSSFWNTEKLKPANSKKFSRLLSQNYVVGCSTIFNKTLYERLKETGFPRNAIMHDHWSALIAAAFGKVDFIKDKTLFHRQHDNNHTGVKVKSLWRDIKKLVSIITFKYDMHKRNRIVRKTVKQAHIFKNIFHNSLDKDNLTIVNNYIKYTENHSLKILNKAYLKSRTLSNFFTFFLIFAYHFKNNKNNLIILLLRLLSSLAAFITIILITNNISQEDAGEFFLYLAFIMPLSLIARFGTDSASAREIGIRLKIDKNFNNVMQLITLITTFFGSMFLAVILLYILSISYDLKYFGDSVLVYVFIILTLLFYSFEKPVCEVLLMKGHYLLSQIIQFGIVPIAIFILAILLVPNYGFNGALLSYLIGSSIFFLAIIFLDLNLNINLKLLIPKKEYVIGAANILLMVIVGLLITQAFIPIVSFTLTLSEIAVVGVILRLTSLISIYSNILKNSSALFFARNLATESYDLIHKRLNLLISLFILIATIYFTILIIFSNFIFGLFGSNYIVEKGVLFIICLSFLITNSTVLYNSVLLLAKKEKKLWKISGFSGSVSIVLISVLTPLYGLYGASIGFLLGCLIDFIFQYRLLRNTIEIKHV